MAIDTLAYAKALEAAGVERPAAEAHAEAITRHNIPDLATKPDLDRAVERLEDRIERSMEQSEHRLTVRTFTMLLAVVGLMDAVLFALLRLVH